ncbi:MAG: hypothetical protein ACYDDU_18935 [Dermatophilaceae bacterium]
MLLNKIWASQSMIGSHFYPQQKLVSKVREGAKITKKYDTAKTPYARVSAHLEVKALPKRRLATQPPRSIPPPSSARSRPSATSS